MDKLKLSWAGDLQSLKDFVNDYLNLNGEWSSPGGERKTFTDGCVSITWWKNKKFLSLNGLDNNMVSKLKSAVCQNKDGCNSEATSSIINSETTIESDPIDSGECRCQDLSTDMEGVKLEIVIAETNIQRQVSSMQTQVTKIQEDFAAIRNDNIELKSQINCVKAINIGGVNEFAAINKTNALLIEYVDTLKCSLSEWESRALETEERNRTLLNSYKVLENTSQSKLQAESALISDAVNDIYIQDKTIKVISQSHIPDLTTPNNAVDDSPAIESNSQGDQTCIIIESQCVRTESESSSLQNFVVDSPQVFGCKSPKPIIDQLIKYRSRQHGKYMRGKEIPMVDNQRHYSSQRPFQERWTKKIKIPSYRTAHRFNSLEWLIHLDAVHRITRQ